MSEWKGMRKGEKAMFRIDIPIEIKVKAPFMTQATEPGGYGMDAVLARNADNRPFIAASLLVGHLRQAWEELAEILQGEPEEVCAICLPETDRLLGAKSFEKDSAPRTRQLFFSDFVLQDQEAPEKGTETKTSRCRISIDQSRGAVEENMLQVMESPFPSGSVLTFAGKVRFEVNEEREAETIKNQIACGLQWMDQIGAFASIGFGTVVDVALKDIKKEEIQILRHGEYDTAIPFSLKPDAPFCIAGRPQADNIFISREIIPGGVVRGALARSLAVWSGQTGKLKELAENFSKIRITHLFPDDSAKRERPVWFPLSTAKTSKGIYDLALMEGPCLIDSEAPAFCPDWKTEVDVREKFRWPSLKKEIRVRTAMDRTKRRQMDEQLFAYEMIQPGNSVWLGRMDLSEVDENVRGKVRDQLLAICRPGILGIGKTKVRCDFELFPQTETSHTTRLDFSGQGLIVTLQTPALLLNPALLKENSDPAALHHVYKKSWKELFQGLCLKRFFARQNLSGGKYQKARFQKDKPYEPWLLTEAGSVFVFDLENVSGKALKERLETWLVTGLPIPSNVRDAYSLDRDRAEADLWNTCPFISQNGYGEIAVNLDVHWRKRPPEDRCKNIEVLNTHSSEEKNHG